MWCPGNQVKEFLEGDSDQPCDMMLKKLNKTSHLQWSCEILLTWIEAILPSTGDTDTRFIVFFPTLA